jgi:hypothetical protein
VLAIDVLSASDSEILWPIARALDQAEHAPSAQLTEALQKHARTALLLVRAKEKGNNKARNFRRHLPDFIPRLLIVATEGPFDQIAGADFESSEIVDSRNMRRHRREAPPWGSRINDALSPEGWP